MEIPQFTPDGLLVTRVNQAGTTFWDPFAGKERFRLAEVFLAHFLPDGRTALGVDWEGVKVWDLAAAGRTGRAEDLLTDGRRLAFSQATGLMAVASGRRVRILDAEGREVATLAGHSRPVRLLAFAPDGVRLATAAQDLSSIDVTAEVKVWDARSGRELRTFQTPPDGRVTGLLFRPDGDDLAVTLAPPVGNTFSESQPERMAEVLDNYYRPAPPGGTGPDVTTRIHVRDLSGGAARFTVSVPGRLLDGVVYTPGGRLLATVARNRLLAWDADGGGQEVSEALPDWQNQQIRKAFSPDGGTLALLRPGLRREPGEAQLWDVAAGRQRHLSATPLLCRGVAFHPEGQRLAAWHGEEVSVWDLASGQKVLALAPGMEVAAAAWSPDGRRLATAGTGLKDPVKLWDADGGGEILTLPPRDPDVHEATEQLAFRPDGAELVLTGRGGQVRVWEAGHWAIPDPEDRAAYGHLAAAADAVQALGKAGDEGVREAYRHGALFHLGRLEGVDWGLAGPHAARARLYAELGRWAEAEADWKQAVERGTTDHLAYHGLALRAVRAGDRAAYRRVCGLMAGRCDRLWVPLLGLRGADYLLRTCALAAGAADDYAPLLRRSAEARPGSQGPILYRAGEAEKAAAMLPNDPGPWAFRPGGEAPPAWVGARPLLFLALCRHAQNKDKEARACLSEAARRLEDQEKAGPQSFGTSDLPAWAVRLEHETLRAEVEAALKPAAGK
jgi:WD40 repeat protein